MTLTSTPVGSPCFRVPWLPGSVVVERFTLLTVLSHSIVDAPTHGVDLRGRMEGRMGRGRMGREEVVEGGGWGGRR